MKNMTEYYDLYLTCDVFSHTDGFEKNRTTCIEY